MSKKIKEMEARKNDLRLQALAIISGAQTEGRFLSDEEDKKVKGFEEEMRKWDETIERMRTLEGDDEEEREHSPIPKPNPKERENEKKVC